MTYTFHPEAETEFVEAVEYYESCQSGLGEDFSFQILATIRNITAFPDAWPIVDNPVRRCLVNRFPFGVLYTLLENSIFILAVMHLHRHPDYWKNRI